MHISIYSYLNFFFNLNIQTLIIIHNIFIAYLYITVNIIYYINLFIYLSIYILVHLYACTKTRGWVFHRLRAKFFPERTDSRLVLFTVQLILSHTYYSLFLLQNMFPFLTNICMNHFTHPSVFVSKTIVFD